MNIKRPRILPFLALALILAGCASTPFVRGVKEAAPDVVAEFTDYINADPSLDASGKEAALADAAALTAAVNAKAVSLDAVESAWLRVRPAYESYVQNDPDLDPIEKSLRSENLTRFDALLAAERQRFIYGS